MHEAGIKKISVIITTTVVVCVYLESAKNSPNVDITIFLSKKKLSTEFLEAGIIAGWDDIQLSIKIHALQPQNFVTFKVANDG